jgi:RNA polymerase sigma factor (TIGR02999 family)
MPNHVLIFIAFLPPPVLAEQEGRNCQGVILFFQETSLSLDQCTQITGLLRAWRNGDNVALELLAPKVYDELRRVARRYMRNERAGNTLQTTALVNEVYLRLVDFKNVDCEHRAQFFALSAQMMRRILVDAARARGSQKRGGGVVRVNVEDTTVPLSQSDASILALNDALEALGKMAPRQAKVVELRYFGGLNVNEIVKVLRISPRTVERDWDIARAWLTRELSQ